MPNISRKDLFTYASTDTKPTTVPAYSHLIESDTGNEYEFDGNTWRQVSVEGVSSKYEASLAAGDEGVGSPTNSQKRTTRPCFPTLLAAVTTAQNIGGALNVPVYIKAITVIAIGTGTVTIAGLSTPTTPAALTTTVVTAAAPPVGSILPPGLDRKFPAGCQITCSVAADGPKILVDWEVLP